MVRGMAAIKFGEKSCTSEKFGFTLPVHFLLDVALNANNEKNLTIWH
jgi:hypothetical protein